MEDLSNKTFSKVDFSNRNLAGANLSHSQFLQCNFTGTDLTEANCTRSRFAGCTMIDTVCRYTDFSHSQLASTFKPKDAYGMIISLECRTFRGMYVSSLWWYCFMQFLFIMVPENDKGVDPREPLKKVIGLSKFFSLQRIFLERQI